MIRSVLTTFLVLPAFIDSVFSVSRGNDECDVGHGPTGRANAAAPWYQNRKVANDRRVTSMIRLGICSALTQGHGVLLSSPSRFGISGLLVGHDAGGRTSREEWACRSRRPRSLRVNLTAWAHFVNNNKSNQPTDISSRVPGSTWSCKHTLQPVMAMTRKPQILAITDSTR